MDETLFRSAGDRLRTWRRTLILTHDRADGDAIGAIGAMKCIIEADGRHADACLFQPAPPRYRFLADACGLKRWPGSPWQKGTGSEPIPSGTTENAVPRGACPPLPRAPGQAVEPDPPYDGILILDTCAWKQLEPAAELLRTTRLPKIVVDHHQTRDDLKGASSELLLIADETAASACGLICEWCRQMGWPPDATARDALFAGLATDTGWFRFPSVDGRTLRAAADLLERGVRPDVMYSRLFEGHRPARLRLLREALETLQLHDDGTIAVMWLTRPMFLLSDATASDSEDLVNEPLQVGSVVVSVLLSENEGDDLIRANFRSRSPEISGRDVDVSAIAAQFGGGGHRRASGARIAGRLDEVRERVLTAIKSACGSSPCSG